MNSIYLDLGDKERNCKIIVIVSNLEKLIFIKIDDESDILQMKNKTVNIIIDKNNYSYSEQYYFNIVKNLIKKLKSDIYYNECIFSITYKELSHLNI